MRTLSVGSITFKDPGKVKAGHAAAATRAENELNPVDEDEDN